jgi:hypothetical protein
MIGEFLRDVAILVLVFYPLDMKPLSRIDRELILLARDYGARADSFSRGNVVARERD